MTSPAKIELRGVAKSFPGVQALASVNLVVPRGAVCALCGENGAGKSTLMKIINGIYQPDEGEIFLDGTPVRIRSPQHAKTLGIGMIFQELHFVPELSIQEGLFVGNLPTTRWKRVDWRRLKKEARALLQSQQLPLHPETKLKKLSISDIQMLEILKASSRQLDLIIMDEPTSAITEREADRLFEKIEELKSKGTTILYISHRMDEIFRIADQITTLRDGHVVSTKPTNEYSISSVISEMVGREATLAFPSREGKKHGKKLLQVRDLCSAGLFEKISFDACAGEIVGFAGLMGAGRTEVMRALVGLDPYQSGSVTINNRSVKIRSVRDSLKNGMVMLSEDRRRFGIIPTRNVVENTSLATLRRYIFRGRLHPKKERREVSELFALLGVKIPNYQCAISTLSGGNQQKVLLARWLNSDPQIFLMDEPTRGIDVGVKFEIYRLMARLTGQGKCLVMVSSELPELMGNCDRIYVMSRGRIVGQLSRRAFSEEAIMRLATEADGRKKS